MRFGLKKEKLWTISLVPICIIITYLSIEVYNSKILLKKYQAKEIIQLEKYRLLNHYFDVNIEANLAINGLQISSWLKDLSISNIFLYVNLENTNCEACIENISLILMNNWNSKYLQKVFIITHFKSGIECKMYMELYFKGINYTNVDHSFYEVSHHPTNTNFFFTVDRMGKIQNIFVPDKNFPEHSITYLKGLKACEE